MGRFADWKAEMEGQEAGAPAAPSAPSPSYLDLQGGKPAPFDVNEAISKVVSSPPPTKQDLPGNTPRLSAPDAPVRHDIALDASRAAAENAETADQRATRQLNAALAGSQSAVPFFPRIRGAVAGFVAEREAALKALAGKERENTEFARMQSAYLERKNAQRQIEQAKAGSPVHAFIGELPVLAALPGGIPAKTAAGRVLGATALGGTYGVSAVDRPGVTTEEQIAGGLTGAGLGLAGGLAGEGVRGIIKSAPKREDAAFMRELTRANAGEGQMAMLAKNKEGILKDYDNIVALRRDPEIRKAINMKKGEGAKIIDEKLEPLRKAQDARYEKIDEAVNHPFNQGAMTPKKLLDQLESAKGAVSSPDVAAKLANVQRQIRSFWIPYAWKNENKTIPSKEFRRWLTTVQGAAANTPGALNWTNTYASTEEASRVAKGIFNRYLDNAALPKVAEEIRRDNTKLTTLLHIKSAIEAKGKKESLQQIGLGQLNEQSNRKLEVGAAGAAFLSGHPEAGVAIFARPYVEKGLAKGARWVNKAALEPLEVAAAAGSKKAKVGKFLAERGLPQGLANEAGMRAASASGEKARSNQPPNILPPPPMSGLFNTEKGR